MPKRGPGIFLWAMRDGSEWSSWSLGPEERFIWRVRDVRLYLMRTTQAWWAASELGRPALLQPEFCHLPPGSPWPHAHVDGLKWTRWAFGEERPAFQVSPVPPDRPLVVKTAPTCVIPPKCRATFYLEIPVFLRVSSLTGGREPVPLNAETPLPDSPPASLGNVSRADAADASSHPPQPGSADAPIEAVSEFHSGPGVDRQSLKVSSLKAATRREIEASNRAVAAASKKAAAASKRSASDAVKAEAKLSGGPLGASADARDVVLRVIPTSLLSSTWFGDFFSGVLSYALPFPASVDVERLSHDPLTAACAFTVFNKSAEDLPLEKICLEATHLALFWAGNRLWTNEVFVSERGGGEPNRIRFGRTPPKVAGPARQLRAAQVAPDEGIFRRTFQFGN